MRIVNSTTRLLAGTLIAIASAASLLSCSKSPEPEVASAFNGVIPRPSTSVRDSGVFVLKHDATITIPAGSTDLTPVAQYFADQVNFYTAFDVKVTEAAEGDIKVSIMDNPSLGDEGYELKITDKNVSLVANNPAGIFYGIQTIRQILTERKNERGQWEMAAGTITDSPNFGWRGSMLDVSRHFFGVNDVKHFIDMIAFYKMNVLHLHLSDDQGWRIEIKSWPNLTAHGGKTQVGGKSGGFYTQEQYADIVSYAKARFITIVPEIDLPGHTNAALASYAELNCNGKAPALYEGKEVGFSSLCLKKEVTFKFVTDVMKELAAITPGPYLHIGGDEAAATPKEDYLKFIPRFREIVQAQGKIMVGWEEIAQADINDGVIAQHWHSVEYASAAAAKGARVLLSPATKVYLDMKYDSTINLGYNWAAYIEVDDAYNWDPETLVPGLSKDKIAGVEAPIWSETFETMDDIEYFLFPRLPGVAEVGWSVSANRDWDEYKVRLGKHGKTMRAMGINFYKSPLIDWVE